MADPVAPVDPAIPIVPTPGGSGSNTSEFWTTITTLVVNLISTLVVSGLVSAKDQGTLTSAVTIFITALATGIPSVGALYAYIRSRVALKTLAHQTQMGLMFNSQALRAQALTAPK